MTTQRKVTLRVKRTKRLRIVKSKARWYSIHSHSKFSAADALPEVKDMVKRAKELGYRGLGLTDHGNIAGTVQLYTECVKAGIKPFPGTELYVVKDREDKSAKRYHLGVLAFTEEGYRNLIHLSTLSHKNFHHKPLLDLSDLAALADEGRLKGLAVTTGCYFGLVIQTLVNDGLQAATQTVAMLKSFFEVCYVELQNHQIQQEPMSEEEIMSYLCIVADELDLKCVSTQDCHYIHEEDKKDHETMKRLVTWSDDVSEAIFPGDGFHMADDNWIHHHMGPYYERSMEGLEDLLERHTLTIPELDVYQPRIPGKHEDPAQVLRRRCEDEFNAYGLDGPYRERLESELDVINYNGMDSYLLLVAEVTDYCRENGIFFQARGSASGSLVCWLMGITPVDPIAYGLLMERFLAKDRKKMPDIDLDIQSSRRQELVDYLSLNYSVTQIGTWQKMSASKTDQGKGSIWVRVFSKLRKEGREPKIESLTREEWAELDRLSIHAPYSSVGKHAGGLLMLGSQEELHHLVPQMWIASSKTMVSQYDMKDVEKLGLVKLDALGLLTMDVLQQTIINMGRDPREMMDFIPMKDPETFKALSKGDTDGVFQLEGGAMRRGIREMRPKNIEDVVAAVALYRPATMNNGGTEQFIERRHKRAYAPKRHQMLMDITKTTQGILLYQEQMISLLRKLGMSPEELNKVLKSIKASNNNVTEARADLVTAMGNVKRLAEDAGMDDDDIDFLESSLLGYADYGFNRSHAVVYGITAYRCAWLAVNQPIEFHAALLSVASGTDKESTYVSATRRRGMMIYRPEINASGVGYTATDTGIVKGFLSIPGVGEKAAQCIADQRPYADLVDFATKVDPRVVTGTRDLLELVKKADGDNQALEEMFRDHTFPGVVGALKNVHAFKTLVKED